VLRIFNFVIYFCHAYTLDAIGRNRGETKAAARIRPNGFRISGIYGEIWWIRWGWGRTVLSAR